MYIYISTLFIFFFLLKRRPPRSPCTDTLFPYTTLFRARQGRRCIAGTPMLARPADIREPLTRPTRDFRSPMTDTDAGNGADSAATRSEEHTSELQSLMRISYAVFCLKKKKNTTPNKYR